MPLHYLYFSTINLYNFTTKCPAMQKLIPLERRFLKNCKSHGKRTAINLHFFKELRNNDLFGRPFGRFLAARQKAVIECKQRTGKIGRQKRDECKGLNRTVQRGCLSCAVGRRLRWAVKRLTNQNRRVFLAGRWFARRKSAEREVRGARL